MVGNITKPMRPLLAPPGLVCGAAWVALAALSLLHLSTNYTVR